MKAYGLSNPGTKRSKNQDSFVLAFNKDNDLLAIVCDGVGSCPFSEMASELISISFETSFEETSFETLDQVKVFIDNKLNDLNDHIYQLSNTKTEYNLMASTIAGVYVSNRFGSIIFNSGDTRIYCKYLNEIKKISVDDTILSDIKKTNFIIPKNLLKKYEHVITNACGIGSAFKVNYILNNDFDYYLLCSDGFYQYHNNENIDLMLDDNNDIENIVRKMVREANRKGGSDNITVVVIKND